MSDHIPDEFDDEYFARLRAAEDQWWVRGMQQVARALMGDLTGRRVLDLGCGTGASIPTVAPVARTPVHATDIAAPALAVCRARHLTPSLTRASMHALPYRAGAFDLVVNGDVLQHLPADDLEPAIHEVARILAPNGRFVVRTNTACLRGEVEESETWRLFDRSRLRSLLANAGLDVERISYANSFGGLLSSVAGRVPRRPGRADGSDGTPHPDHGLGIPDARRRPRDRVLGATLRLEARWLHAGRRIPFGHALVAVARKPATPSDPPPARSAAGVLS